MKAIILNKNFELEAGYSRKPRPKSHEILILIKSSGFNPIDYQMLENDLERKLISSAILGREFSGIVVHKGSNVTQLNIGDEVFCGSGSMGSNGTYAKFIAVPEAIVALKPKNISFEQAAAIPSVGMTALQIYNRLLLNHNNSFLITGAAGGVGSFLVKLLLAHNFSNITATAGNDESRNILISIGLKPHQIINYKNEKLVNDITKANNHRPFDIGIDLVGNYMSEIIADVLKINGTYVDVTALTTEKSRETLFNKGNLVLNISNYAYATINNYNYYRDSLNEIAKLIESNIITPPNYKNVGRFSLDTVLKAHAMLKNNQTQGNKLIMTHE